MKCGSSLQILLVVDYRATTYKPLLHCFGFVFNPLSEKMTAVEQTHLQESWPLITQRREIPVQRLSTNITSERDKFFSTVFNLMLYVIQKAVNTQFKFLVQIDSELIPESNTAEANANALFAAIWSNVIL